MGLNDAQLKISKIKLTDKAQLLKAFSWMHKYFNTDPRYWIPDVGMKFTVYRTRADPVTDTEHSRTEWH